MDHAREQLHRPSRAWAILARLAAGALAAGCTDDPWAFAPGPPAAPEREELWAWSVRGTVVGQEERSLGHDATGEWAFARTTFAFREGSGDTGRPDQVGRERWVRRVTTVRCGAGACSGERWSGDHERERLAGTCAPEWFGGAEGSCVPLGGVDTPLVRDAEVVRFSRPTGDRSAEVRVGLDEVGTPAWVEVGGLRGERVTGPIELRPVDVAALTAQPVERMPNARGSRVGVFRVAEVERHIEVPTAAELPSRDVARLTRMVEQVVAHLPTDAGCKEHAAALVNAARAGGYPARIVFGRVYVESASGAAMVLHAWAEVEIGGRWVGADSAFGQFPADASHLPLAAYVDELVASDEEITLVTLR